MDIAELIGKVVTVTMRDGSVSTGRVDRIQYHTIVVSEGKEILVPTVAIYDSVFEDGFDLLNAANIDIEEVTLDMDPPFESEVDEYEEDEV